MQFERMAAGQSDYFWTAREIQILFVFLELNIKLPLKQLCPIHVDVKIKKRSIKYENMVAFIFLMY